MCCISGCIKTCVSGCICRNARWGPLLALRDPSPGLAQVHKSPPANFCCPSAWSMTHPPSSTWSNFEDLISGLGPFSTQLWDLWPPSKQGRLPPALDCNCPELPDTFNFPERGAKWGHYNSLFVLIMGDPCLRHQGEGMDAEKNGQFCWDHLV